MIKSDKFSRGLAGWSQAVDSGERRRDNRHKLKQTNKKRLKKRF